MTGERVSYHVMVERKRQRRFFFKLVKIGMITTAVVVGTVLLAQHITHSAMESSIEGEKLMKEGNGLRSWRKRIGIFFEEVASPFL